MKKPALLLLTALTSVLADCAHAQPFSLDWFTMDSGGGAATVGNFSVMGTIGQPDAGPALTAGTFSIVGGFWSLPPVQGAPAPMLHLLLTSPGVLRISWPSSLAGFSIQQTLSLGSPNWTSPSESVNDDGINKSIVVNTATGTRFFRLMHP
jgi:hypothetical protein